MGNSMIGVDISSSDVCMAQVQGFSVVLAVEHLPENLIREDRIVSQELLATFLKQMKNRYKFAGRKCQLILPEYSTFFRSLTMPVMNAERLMLNLPYEFRDYVGDESMNYFYDYAVDDIPRDDKGEPTGIDILAAAGLKATIREYGEILHRAGMKLSVSVPREMALLKLLRSHQIVGDQPFGLVDVGYEHTRVYLFRGRNLEAAKIMDIGCRQIDEAIAATLNIDPYLAASYRETNHENVLDLDACHSVYSHISLEVMKTVNFYVYENPQAEFSGIFFCGAGAAVEPLINEVLGDTRLGRHYLSELMPEGCKTDPLAAQCAMAIGATL